MYNPHCQIYCSSTNLTHLRLFELINASLKPAVKLHNGQKICLDDVMCHHMVDIFAVFE